MDNEYSVDLGEVRRVIDTSDVFIVRFATVDKRLLVDNRHSEVDGPMIRLVSRAGSVEERFRELRKMRPRFPLPDRISSFYWPKYVRSLERMGVLDHLIRRFGEMGYDGTESRCREVFQELLLSEQRELMAAIKGDGYETLWQRKSKAP